MRLYEFQIKALLQKYGIPTPEVILCSEEKEVALALENRGLKQAIVKAQVHASSRREYGGILVASTPEEIYAHSKTLLGKRFVTPYQDVLIEKVLIDPVITIAQEYYINFFIDYDHPFLLAYTDQGSLRLPLRIDGTMYSFQLFTLMKALDIEEKYRKSFCALIEKVAWVFTKIEAVYLAMHPLVLTQEGFWIVVDAKCTIDARALFRHAGIAAYFGSSYEETRALHVMAHDPLGTTAVLTSGVGLATAILDEMVLSGVKLSHLFDVGEHPNKTFLEIRLAQVSSARRTTIVLIYLTWGYDRCTLKNMLIEALSSTNFLLPCVVCCQGVSFQEEDPPQENIVMVSSLQDAIREVHRRSQGSLC